jgi:hypothetical protein
MMLDSLITSQTRIKLLLKFFIDSSTKAYLRGLESEFGDSTNGIRIELNRLEQAGLLVSAKEGNKKLYQANRKHPLFKDIHSLIMKEIVERGKRGEEENGRRGEGENPTSPRLRRTKGRMGEAVKRRKGEEE